MFDELVHSIDRQVLIFLEDNAKHVTPESIGLDSRSGYELYVGEDFIAVGNSSRGSLEYYGGFEYVSREAVTVVGDYTFYSSYGEDRVQDCIDIFTRRESKEG